MDRDMGRDMSRDMGSRGMRGMFDDGRGRGYDTMVVAEAIGRLGRGGEFHQRVE